ncbi:hypothetical protein [Subtercola boreus]|uniref:hypothetical protein n=1 Tax=Subtercola boreus TaxID=120213 RepID=UPI0015597172|nr:hypothetical protein [Subtercola boreus]
MDPEVLRNPLDRHTRLTVSRHAHNIITELSRIRLRHNNILPARPQGKPTQMSPIRAADPGVVKSYSDFDHDVSKFVDLALRGFLRNNFITWALILVFLITTVPSSLATFWYQGWANALIVVGITVVLSVIPLIIYRRRKPSWATDVARSSCWPSQYSPSPQGDRRAASSLSLDPPMFLGESGSRAW